METNATPSASGSRHSILGSGVTVGFTVSPARSRREPTTSPETDAPTQEVHGGSITSMASSTHTLMIPRLASTPRAMSHQPRVPVSRQVTGAAVTTASGFSGGRATR